jgi:hypothetical protein
MPFSSGKKAVIFNRADSWDFSSYREGDGNALPLFDKEKVASSSLLALAPSFEIPGLALRLKS